MFFLMMSICSFRPLLLDTNTVMNKIIVIGRQIFAIKSLSNLDATFSI